MAAVDEIWRREGRFWPPDHETSVYGWIDYDPEPDRGFLVHLLESPFAEGPMEIHDVAVLHGESLDGWPFSLLGGERIGPRTITLSNSGTADVVFDTLVQGRHVTSLSEVTGTMAHVRLHGLKDVLTGGGFGQTLLAVSADRECSEHRVVGMEWGELQLFAAGVQTKWTRHEHHARPRTRCTRGRR